MSHARFYRCEGVYLAQVLVGAAVSGQATKPPAALPSRWISDTRRKAPPKRRATEYYQSNSCKHPLHSAGRSYALEQRLFQPSQAATQHNVHDAHALGLSWALRGRLLASKSHSAGLSSPRRAGLSRRSANPRWTATSCYCAMHTRRCYSSSASNSSWCGSQQPGATRRAHGRTPSAHAAR